MKHTKYLIGVIISAQLFTAFIGRSLNSFGAYIGDSFELTHFQIGLIPMALFIGQFLSTFPTGFVSDYISTHKIMLILMLTVGIGFVSLSLVQESLFILLLFVILAGLGYGGMHPVTNKMIVQLYPNDKTSLQMGLKQMSIALGSALSSVILIAIAERTDWRFALGTAAGMLIVFAVITFIYLQKYKDIFNSFQFRNHAILEQLKGLITYKSLFFITIIALLLMALQVTFNTYLLLFLIDVKGWAIYLAGAAFACSEIFGAIGRVMWGVISDYFFRGNRWIALLIIAVLFPIALYNLYVAESHVFIFIFVACIGFSLSGFNGIWMSLAVESVPKSISGSASGYSVTIGSLGVFFIPPLFGYISDTLGYEFAGLFMICIGLICIILTCFALWKTKILKSSNA